MSSMPWPHTQYWRFVLLRGLVVDGVTEMFRLWRRHQSYLFLNLWEKFLFLLLCENSGRRHNLWLLVCIWWQKVLRDGLLQCWSPSIQNRSWGKGYNRLVLITTILLVKVDLSVLNVKLVIVAGLVVVLLRRWEHEHHILLVLGLLRSEKVLIFGLELLIPWSQLLLLLLFWLLLLKQHCEMFMFLILQKKDS